jgi:predicted nucleic acid-binding protein
VTCLLDVNLLMALLWENHEHHAKVRSWFKGVSSFAICPVVQLSFARVSSHSLLGYGMTPDTAFGVLRQFLADPRHQFMPDDLSCTDRYLFALARQHGFSLATLDEPLAKSFVNEPNLVELVP